MLRLHSFCNLTDLLYIFQILLVTTIYYGSWDKLLTCSLVFQQPAINVLKEVQAFLEGNPTEIVTTIIEDYVTSPNGLTNVFAAAGLAKYRFPVTRMPKNGEDWPTVDDMIRNNQRLVVFTSKSSKEASEGTGYQWDYMVENQCMTHTGLLNLQLLLDLYKKI